MKKKKPVHPKLFINIDIDKMTIFFKQNKFNHKGDRLIEEELLESKDLVMLLGQSTYRDLNKAEKTWLKSFTS